MLRYAVIAGILTVVLPTASSFGLTPKQKMETCKFGADDLKLQGVQRRKFISRCMANRDDPRGPPPPTMAPRPMAPAGAPPPPPRQ